ncbi:MAG: c-type cytochrome [Gammaproteobacteria bacterium]|jgi:cytochrome c5|nr:c-type cytochrome [Gammaproteobacteria bacterium]
MNVRVIAATVISLAMVSCGKSDESADTGGTVKEVSDTPVVTGVEQQTDEAVDTSVDQTASINTGESIYSRACAGCHISGAANAPKLGDKAAWADRIARGADALVLSAINGVPGTAMMARGTCNSCSDDDIKAAVEYMISQSQ